MGSLFQRTNNREIPAPPTPHELIEPEIVHLRKGYSVRYGPRAKKRNPLWLTVIAFGGLLWLYLMDPFYHAWYKGEAVHTYLYLHNYGTGPLANELLATQIFAPDEVEVLNGRHGAFQDYYASPDAANKEAQTIIDYMTNVRELHAGHYENLDPVGRMRYLLFIRTGIVLPRQWDFLDPAVSE